MVALEKAANQSGPFGLFAELEAINVMSPCFSSLSATARVHVVAALS